MTANETLRTTHNPQSPCAEVLKSKSDQQPERTVSSNLEV